MTPREPSRERTAPGIAGVEPNAPFTAGKSTRPCDRSICVSRSTNSSPSPARTIHSPATARPSGPAIRSTAEDTCAAVSAPNATPPADTRARVHAQAPARCLPEAIAWAPQAARAAGVRVVHRPQCCHGPPRQPSGSVCKRRAPHRACAVRRLPGRSTSLSAPGKRTATGTSSSPVARESGLPASTVDLALEVLGRLFAAAAGGR